MQLSQYTSIYVRTWKVLDSQQFYLPEVVHIQQHGHKFCHSTEIVATENSQPRNILQKQGTNLVLTHMGRRQKNW